MKNNLLSRLYLTGFKWFIYNFVYKNCLFKHLYINFFFIVKIRRIFLRKFWNKLFSSRRTKIICCCFELNHVFFECLFLLCVYCIIWTIFILIKVVIKINKNGITYHFVEIIQNFKTAWIYPIFTSVSEIRFKMQLANTNSRHKCNLTLSRKSIRHDAT